MNDDNIEPKIFGVPLEKKGDTWTLKVDKLTLKIIRISIDERIGTNFRFWAALHEGKSKRAITKLRWSTKLECSLYLEQCLRSRGIDGL